MSITKITIGVVENGFTVETVEETQSKFLDPKFYVFNWPDQLGNFVASVLSDDDGKIDNDEDSKS